MNEEKIALNETKSRQEKEQMLIDLYNYLSKEPTDDIYDGGQYGKGHLNIKYKAYNYFEPKLFLRMYIHLFNMWFPNNLATSISLPLFSYKDSIFSKWHYLLLDFKKNR